MWQTVIHVFPLNGLWICQSSLIKLLNDSLKTQIPLGKGLQLLSSVHHGLLKLIPRVSKVKEYSSLIRLVIIVEIFFISVEHKSKRHSLHATYPVSYVSIVAECCQVMFDYKAKAEDELDLKKGDVVLILKKVFFPHCLLTHFFMMSRSWNRFTKSFKAHCVPLWLQNYHPAKPVESLWEILWQRAHDRLCVLKIKWDNGKSFFMSFLRWQLTSGVTV